MAMAALGSVLPSRLASRLAPCSRLLSQRRKLLGGTEVASGSRSAGGGGSDGVACWRPGRRIHSTPVSAVSAAAGTGTTGPYKLPDLPYNYSALEPFIDTATMRAHHDGHHAAYVNKLNEAIREKEDLKGKSLDHLQKVAIESGAAVRNNAGGHYNHSLYWTYMAPRGQGLSEPSGKLKDAIGRSFGSFQEFRAAFNGACEGVFGSGWVWLGVDEDGGLSIETTANQDNPLMEGVVLSKNTASGDRVPRTGGKSRIIPFLGQDVWEHAYYIKYQNRKAEYFSAWWIVLNWDQVCEYYEKYAARGQVIPVHL